MTPGNRRSALPSADVNEEDEERRRGERRAGERRRWRSEPGRRAGDARRSEDRERARLTPLLLAAAVVLVVGVGYRALVVAPVRGARAEATEVGAVLAPVLESVELPLQAVPGFGAPEEGDPATGPALGGERRQAVLAVVERLEAATAAAPKEPGPWRVLARARFALGEERAARIAWQQTVALGGPEAQAEARVGLAALAIRVALRSAGEQDRAFALEHALDLLARVPADSPAAPHRRFEEAVAHLALDQQDRADVALAELAGLSGTVSDEGLTVLRAVRSGEERLSETLDGLLDPKDGPE